MTSPDAIDCIGRLRELAEENERLSQTLMTTERELEAVQVEYDDFMRDHKIGLWQRAQDDRDFKLPSEDMRTALAQRDMKPELLGRHRGLTAARDRLSKRQQHIKMQAESYRTIISAMKEGLVT